MPREQRAFKNWECDEKKMKLTKGGKALYLHCLPRTSRAVSCAQARSRGGVREIPLRDVSRSELQAVRIAAMIFLARVQSPLAALKKLAKD